MDPFQNPLSTAAIPEISINSDNCYPPIPILDQIDFPTLLPAPPIRQNLTLATAAASKSTLIPNLNSEIPVSSNVNSTTWSSVINKMKKSAGSIPMNYYPPLAADGMVEIEKEIEEEGILMWEETVVGFFLDKKLSYPVMESYLKRNWKLMGEVQISLDSDIFYFNFSNAEDRIRILDEGSISVKGKPFIIRPWSQDIEENRGTVKNVPIWIKLFNVPKHLWSVKGLSKIASSIGRPLFMDKITEERKMLSFARVLIDVNAEKELPQHIRVKFSSGRITNIPVEFTWKPLICTKCQVFCHTNENCLRSIPIKAKQTSKQSHQEKNKNRPVEIEVEQMSKWKEKTALTIAAQQGDASVSGLSNRFDVLIDNLDVEEIPPPTTTRNGDMIETEVSKGLQESNVVTVEKEMGLVNEWSIPKHTVRPRNLLGNQSIVTNLVSEDVHTPLEEGELAQCTSEGEGVGTEDTVRNTRSPINVAYGFHILGENEEVPESLKGIVEEVELVNSRMKAFLEQNKENSSHQTPSVGIRQKTGGRGRLKGVSSSKTISDASDESSLGLRKSQREPTAPVRLNL